jgi:metallo-beta-lactamase class B
MHELEAPDSVRGLWKPGGPVALDGTVTTLGRAFPPFQPDRKLKDGETVEWGGRRLVFRSAPGHTPGTMMIEFPLRGADGKTYRVGLLGGIAPGKPEFTATCRRLRHLEIDVVLGAHPSQNDTLAKAEKLAAHPAKNPFVNPEEWRSFLDKMIARAAGKNLP